MTSWHGSEFGCLQRSGLTDSQRVKKEVIVVIIVRQNIRIFNRCEMQIENSVTRVTVRHQEAYRLLWRVIQSDVIFHLYPNHRLFFFRKLVNASFYVKIARCSGEKSTDRTSQSLMENDIYSRRQSIKRRPELMSKYCTRPWYRTSHPGTGQSRGHFRRVCNEKRERRNEGEGERGGVCKTKQRYFYFEGMNIRYRIFNQLCFKSESRL